MDLTGLLNGLRDRLGLTVVGPEHVRVCDLTEDSRTVLPGSMFVARPGGQADGRAFIADAVRAGAAAILTDHVPARDHAADVPLVLAPDIALASALIADRFYGEPARKLRTVGVTGTNGKTTVTWLCWRLLNECGLRAGLIGTVLVDDGREVARASHTTPPAIELARTLATMVEGGCRAAVLEVSSHALDQKRADALAFDVAVFTNLTGDHLDYHGSMERYAAAKARLFGLVRPGGVALHRAADPWAGAVLAGCRAPRTACHVGTPGLFAPADAGDARAEILSESMDGMRLRLDGPWGVIEAPVPLIGEYNAMNVLHAVAAAHALGVRSADLERALPRAAPPPGRLEAVTRADDRAAVFVDFAHSDDSLRNVLVTVRRAMQASGRGGRLHVVFGCGGDRDRTKRPRMGAAAAELADAVVVTSDNPRSEPPGDIIDQVLSGVPPQRRAAVTVHADRETAITATIRAAWAGGEGRDVVVIAGKGHETEQILPDGRGGLARRPFDDREVASSVVEALRGGAGAKGGRRPTRPAGRDARRRGRRSA
ncbi:MAG: UDP-N-acetylmuramoyl-L-alanyl-D-glutamate--2,6-diaminopimelate ligase [Phycisphaerae bacterium]|nr:UDP-N-acetylmuramoyl-L-alanyl-D-glutamate--2,6-diaminopimelate ligase [Phycisphaerae bacterium]